jgi:hypothetical protein
MQYELTQRHIAVCRSTDIFEFSKSPIALVRMNIKQSLISSKKEHSMNTVDVSVDLCPQ